MGKQQQLQQALQKSVDRKDVAGAVALVHRGGATECVAAGWRDIEEDLPMQCDAIFRIASMTKPITSVAALMLVDEGRMRLDDPITHVIPEFARMRVLRSQDGPLEDTVEADRPITIEDLLTHRAGLTYSGFHRGPIGEAYRAALGGDVIDSELSPDEWVGALARLPLIAQPGSLMTYGTATDLLGFLIARVEGDSLGAVLKRRIFDPLGMADTAFFVPPDKRARRASAYGFDNEGQLMKRLTWGGVVVEERPRDMAYESGSGGLWSTAEDYLKFARLFLGDGEVDGVRLLRRETLARMMTNQLTESQRANSGWWGQKPFAVGRGFGLGVAVVLEPSEADMARRGSEGTVSWPGAYGGWWLADPKGKSIFIFLAHNMVDPAQFAKGIGLGVWTAIEEVQRAALA